MVDSQDKGHNLKAEDNKATQASKNTGIYVYLVILTIAILGFGFNQFYNDSYNQAKHDLNKKNLSEQKDYIETFLKSLSKNTEQNFSSIFDNQQKQINTLKKQVTESLNRNSNEWGKAEIDYLIKSANLQLKVYNNPTKALALLQLARKVAENDLSGAHESNILELINSDLEKLKNIKTDNIDELLAIIPETLKELSKNLKSNLQAKIADQNKLNNDESDIKKDNTDKDRSFKNKLIKKLENIVVIRKHGTPTKPIFDEYESNFIMLNLNIYFEALALSLLENNQELYEIYLNKLENIITTYNLGNDNILKQIAKLKEANFNKYASINLESLS